MIRRLNFTGRRKIPRSRLAVRLLPGDGACSFSIDYDLRGFDFPADALVFIEAYNVASYMRFAFGTVSQRRTPADTRLTEVTTRPLPRFRLKVVEASRRVGLLLGVADQVVPLRPDEEPEQRQSLLPVDFCDLGDRPWRLDLSDGPLLELNHRIDGIAEAARSSGAFLGLVYPEVFRRILHDILIEQDMTDPGFDDSEWSSLWLRYACSLPGVPAPPTAPADDARSRRIDWIEQAVSAFCSRRRAAGQLEAAIGKEMG